MNIKLKICGMRDNISEVSVLQPDYMGFIFYHKSKRYVGKNFDADLLKDIPCTVKKTGVFVNEKTACILNTAGKYSLDAVQLHGDETPGACEALSKRGLEVIKAFGIHEAFDFTALAPYKSCCNYFLFDNKSKQYGGSGTAFDWSLLEKYDGEKPFFLSGGIGREEIKKLQDPKKAERFKNLNMYAVDVNSKAEITPGMKSEAYIKSMLNTLKEIQDT